MALDQLDICRQKNEFGPLPHTIYKKLTQKWQKILSIKSKTIKLVEENIGVNLCDLRFDNGFLDKTPKAQATKEKNR